MEQEATRLSQGKSCFSLNVRNLIISLSHPECPSLKLESGTDDEEKSDSCSLYVDS